MSEDEIAGTFLLEDGSKYIFMLDETIYKQDVNGKLTQIESNSKNIKKIQEDLGIKTDVVK